MMLSTDCGVSAWLARVMTVSRTSAIWLSLNWAKM